jgi:DNA processing protein
MAVTPPKNDQARIEWLRLIRSENVGPITFFQLINRFGSAGNALEAIPKLARKGGRKRPIALCSVADAEQEFKTAKKLNAEILFYGDSLYPQLLTEIRDAPPILYAKGDTSLFHKPGIAIIGSRNASAGGRRLAQLFAQELGNEGYNIISGLARGIDSSAHQASLHTGTIAVMAGGIDIIYPSENKQLYENIADKGILLTENLPGIEPQARHFPRRNRLISGLSLGVIVVEAAPKSGSLITANFALDQGREVFAIPGSPLDPRARGTNNLLSQGATLVQSGRDVIEALKQNRTSIQEAPKQFKAPEVQPPSEHDVEHARTELLSLLSPAPIALDELLRLSDITPNALFTVLLEFELAGKLERHPGNKVSLYDIEELEQSA